MSDAPASAEAPTPVAPSALPSPAAVPPAIVLADAETRFQAAKARLMSLIRNAVPADGATAALPSASAASATGVKPGSPTGSPGSPHSPARGRPSATEYVLKPENWGALASAMGVEQSELTAGLPLMGHAGPSARGSARPSSRAPAGVGASRPGVARPGAQARRSASGSRTGKKVNGGGGGGGGGKAGGSRGSGSGGGGGGGFGSGGTRELLFGAEGSYAGGSGRSARAAAAASKDAAEKRSARGSPLAAPFDLHLRSDVSELRAALDEQQRIAISASHARLSLLGVGAAAAAGRPVSPRAVGAALAARAALVGARGIISRGGGAAQRAPPVASAPGGRSLVPPVAALKAPAAPLALETLVSAAVDGSAESWAAQLGPRPVSYSFVTTPSGLPSFAPTPVNAPSPFFSYADVKPEQQYRAPTPITATPAPTDEKTMALPPPPDATTEPDTASHETHEKPLTWFEKVKETVTHAAAAVEHAAVKAVVVVEHSAEKAAHSVKGAASKAKHAVAKAIHSHHHSSSHAHDSAQLHAEEVLTSDDIAGRTTPDVDAPVSFDAPVSEAQTASSIEDAAQTAPIEIPSLPPSELLIANTETPANKTEAAVDITATSAAADSMPSTAAAAEGDIVDATVASSAAAAEGDIVGATVASSAAASEGDNVVASVTSSIETAEMGAVDNTVTFATTKGDALITAPLAASGDAAESGVVAFSAVPPAIEAGDAADSGVVTFSAVPPAIEASTTLIAALDTAPEVDAAECAAQELDHDALVERAAIAAFTASAFAEPSLSIAAEHPETGADSLAAPIQAPVEVVSASPPPALGGLGPEEAAVSVDASIAAEEGLAATASVPVALAFVPDSTPYSAAPPAVEVASNEAPADTPAGYLFSVAPVLESLSGAQTEPLESILLTTAAPTVAPTVVPEVALEVLPTIIEADSATPSEGDTSAADVSDRPTTSELRLRAAHDAIDEMSRDLLTTFASPARSGDSRQDSLLPSPASPEISVTSGVDAAAAPEAAEAGRGTAGNV